MSDIRIDLDQLLTAQARLLTVIGEFDRAGHVQSHLPAATGHQRVMSVMESFNSACSIRRNELNEELNFIKDAVEAIRETFEQIDADLAARVAQFASTGDDSK